MKLFNEDKHIGLVFTDKEIIYEEEGIFYYSHSKSRENAAREILLTNFIGSTSCVMVKASLLKENKFDVSMPAFQDHDLWIRLCRECKVGHVRKPLLKYYQRTSLDQISSDYTKYITACEIMDEKYARYFSELTSDEESQLQSYRINGLLLKTLRSKDKDGYMKLLKNLTFSKKILGNLKWALGYESLLRIKALLSKE